MEIRMKFWQWCVIICIIISIFGSIIVHAIIEHPGPALNQEPAKPLTFIRVEDTHDYDIWRHTVTGCHYVETGGSSGSFTPMVTETGEPFCK